MDDTTTRIKEVKLFLEENCLSRILAAIREGKLSIVFDFDFFKTFDIQFQTDLLDNPEECLKEIEYAITDLEGTKLIPRIKGLPKTQHILIKDIRSAHLEKFVCIEGLIRQSSTVRPRITSIRFECPSCENIISVLQLDSTVREPKICGCGRKGKFHILSKEMVDTQKIVIEELPERLSGKEHPQRCNVILQGDLTDKELASYCNPGTQVKITGILKEVPIYLRSGGKSVDVELIMNVNHIETEEFTQDFSTTDEEGQQIMLLAKDKDYFDNIISSIAPEIYGMDLLKEAIAYHIPGGNKIKRGNKHRVGDIHILAVTDPALAKSTTIQSLKEATPKLIYADCTGLTGPGLSASAVRDEFMSGFVVEAGAAVLASGGSLVLDELDKLDKEHIKTLHVIMSEQRVVKHVANLHVEMKSECGVIGLCNPKSGRFDPNEEFTNQIDMSPSLISRFDIPILLRDIPETEKDTGIADSILEFRDRNITSIIDPQLLRKIFMKAKTYNPALNSSAKSIVKKYYLELRQKYDKEQKLLITARQLETLIKLTESCAKLRMSNLATELDAERAVKFFDKCIRAANVYKEGIGVIDVEGIGFTRKEKFKKVKQAMRLLEPQLGGVVSFEDIQKETNIEVDDLEETIQQLIKEQEIFEPKSGFYKLL